MTDNTYPNLNAVDNIYRQNKVIMDAAAKAEAMDALPPMRSQAAARLASDMIAGSVKSPDWPENVQRLQEAQSRGEYVPPMQAASARIKGDKDRDNPVERPQLEYDHTQDGTANFERALLYASYHEVEAERLTQALERANAQTEQFERDYYLKCDEHERDLKDAAAYMGKRDAEIEALTELAHQYLSDLRYPPSSDSKERRIERIKAVLKQVQP